MFASRFAKRMVPVTKNIRNMSGHSAEEAKAEVARWINISIGT
jgi:hypothetical protein